MPSALNVNVKKFKKARVNGVTDNDSLKDSYKSLRCRWQTRIIWYQTISSTQPSCWIQNRRWMWSTLRPIQMFMTLTGELSWQRLRWSAVDFQSKNEKIALWATLSGLRGNVGTPTIARWKAHGRRYIRVIDFFAISYGWDVMSGNRSKLAFFEGGGSIWAQISEGRGHRPPTTVGVSKLQWLPFRVYENICSPSFSFVTIHASDRRTDGRTEFRQQYRALHYMQSHGKKYTYGNWQQYQPFNNEKVAD